MSHSWGYVWAALVVLYASLPVAVQAGEEEGNPPLDGANGAALVSEVNGLRAANSNLAPNEAGGAARPPRRGQEGRLSRESGGSEENRLGVGLRVGGYGFREIDGDSSTQWTDCRMDGLGVFNTVSFTPSWFLETSLDYYQAIGRVVEEEGMDRISLQALAVGGFRAFPSSFFSPTIQLGIGGEFTRVTWSGYEDTLASFFPMGFVGAGGEFSIGDHAVLGGNIRMFMMAGLAPQEEHEHSEGVHLHTPTHAEPQAAGQLQFWFRYDL